MRPRLVKLICLFLALCLAAVASAGEKVSNPVLVLVERGTYDPDVNPDTYVHPTWVRWPEASAPGRDNRLFSIMTDVDWRGERAAWHFRASGRSWLAEGYPVLADIGYFRE